VCVCVCTYNHAIWTPIRRLETSTMDVSLRSTVLVYLCASLCCPITKSSSTASSQGYKMVKSPTGKTMCATDRPTASETLRHSTASWTRCAAACSSSPCCLLFQFRANSSTCELFGFMPVGFVTATNCTAYAVFPGKCRVKLTKNSSVLIIM
jgi:hypothetical protein